MITPQVKASGNVNGVERLTLYLKREEWERAKKADGAGVQMRLV